MISEVKKINDVMVVELIGSLDVSLQVELKDKLLRTFAENRDGDVVLDFKKVNFIDSSCLGVLVSLTRKLRVNKADIKLVNMTDDVRSIFQITRLDKIFEIYDDVDEALDSFYKKSHDV